MNVEGKRKVDLNKILIWLFNVSIFPTVLFGILKISTYENSIVWIWDAFVIIFAGCFCFIKNFELKRCNLILSFLFMIIIFFQFISYFYSIEHELLPILYVVVPALYFLHFFIAFNIFSNIKKITTNNLTSFLTYFLYFVVFCCIYNMIVNATNFSKIFLYSTKYLGFSSFFNHRNGFGQLLFWGIVVSTYLMNKNNFKKYKTAFLIIFLNLILTFSRASILSSTVFLILFYFQKLFFEKKRKKSVLILIFLSAILLFTAYNFFTNRKFIEFLNYYVFRSSDGLSGRDYVWKIALSNLHGIKSLIGYGLGTSSTLLKSSGLSNAHNSILELLLSGGIVMLLLYVIIFAIEFSKIKKFEDKNLKKTYYSMFISIIVYIMFEKILMFGTGYASILFTIFIVIIPNFYGGQNDKKIS